MSELRYIVAPITRVEVRDPTRNDDNTWTMSGYAAVFNQQTTLYDGRFIQVKEQMDPGAFRNVFASQPMNEPSGVVHFNFGHDMNRAVAATDVPEGQPGSLRLNTDGQGLRYLAKVSRDDPDGVALAAKMRSGVVKQASFAFTIDQMDTTEEEDDDGKTYYSDTIMSVGHLYDVCACAQGAYSQTVSGLRTYARNLGQPVPDLAVLAGGHQRQPDLGGAKVVSPTRGGGPDITPPAPAEDPMWAAIAARASSLMPMKAATRGDRDVRPGQEPDDALV